MNATAKSLSVPAALAMMKAAPALLAALKHATALIEAADLGPSAELALRQYRAAIAKAEAEL